MSQQDCRTDGYIQPEYTMLKPRNQDSRTEMSQAILAFLKKFPEFSKSRQHMEYLAYCYKHYVNYDPELRDLSIQEKLVHAGNMAKDFLGTITGAQA